jgi:hypothetical protein
MYDWLIAVTRDPRLIRACCNDLNLLAPVLAVLRSARGAIRWYGDPLLLRSWR